MKIFKTAMILTASALALTACSETTVTHAPKDTAAKTQSFLTNCELYRFTRRARRAFR